MLAAIWLCLALWPAVAAATDIPVTTTADVSGDDEACSLREAIQAAQTNTAIGPSGTVDCPAGATGGNVDFVQLQAATYSISGAANENANISGDFDLDWTGNTQSFLTIEGTLGAGDVPLSIIDGANQDRIFDIQSGGTPALEIMNVILRNGAPPGAGSDGGAIEVRDDDPQFDLTTTRILDSDAGHYGGGLHFENGANGSDLDITQTEFAGNTAGDEGGALWVEDNSDPIQVVRSSFVGNSAEMGGAIYQGSISTSGQLFITNSTLSGNTAADAGGAFAFDADVGGNVYFNFSTIAGNTTPTAGGGGGIYTNSPDQFVLIGDSILAGNTAAGAPSNCAGPGPFANNGNRNIESANTCGFLGANNNLVNTDPLLGPIAFNSGGDQTTRTQGLYDASPALDKIPTGNCGGASGMDQRSIARPVGAGCDTGAFEGSIGPKPAGPANPSPTTPAAKKCKKKKKKKGKAGAQSSKKKKKKCKKKKKKKKG